MFSSHSFEKVERELKRLGIPIAEIEYGVVRFQEKLNAAQSLQVKLQLPKLGFEVLDTFESELLDEAALLIKGFVYNKPHLAISDYPAYIEEQLSCDEIKINKLFYQVLGVSICQWATIQQVERMKELVLYDNFNLHQVADLLYLGDEIAMADTFQTVTGLAPAYLNEIKYKRFGIRHQNKLMPIEERICVKAINTAN